MPPDLLDPQLDSRPAMSLRAVAMLPRPDPPLAQRSSGRRGRCAAPARPRGVAARGLRRRAHVDVPPEARAPLRAAAPGVEITAADFIRAFHRLLAPVDRLVASPRLSRHRRGDRVQRRHRRVDLRDRGPRRPHARLPSHRGSRGLRCPSRAGPRRAAATEPRPARRDLRRSPRGRGRLRPLPRLVRPVHVRRLRGARLLRSGGAADAGRGLRAGADHARAEPVLGSRRPTPCGPAYADRIEITLVDSVDEAVAALDAGTADFLWPSGDTVSDRPGRRVRRLPGRPRARPGLPRPDGGLSATSCINVAVPPFDDLHVRKALN